jgi:ADP-ribose pyrophosphatase YjhB (NUDIX family)
VSAPQNPYGGTPNTLRASACAFVQDPGGRVLLQRRSDNGFWNLPGGGVELGESVAAACAREVREETGLEVEVLRLVGVYSDPAFTTVRYADGRAVQYVVSLFECRVLGGELRVDEESLELGWFAPDALPEPFSPNHVPRLQDALARRDAAFYR